MFGTDGVRGQANSEPMTPETALKLGRALACVLRESAGRRPRALIGKDTRLSGYMLETAVAAGLCSSGVDVRLVGPLPTPGIAFLTASMRCDAGVVISASHNGFEDNGIKFFGRDGFKLDDTVEARIEGLVNDGAALSATRVAPAEIGKAFRVDDAVGRYLVFLKSCVGRKVSFDGLKVVVDCANGAAYRVAPELLTELGAEVVSLGVDPNGTNINLGCGALCPHTVRQALLDHRADVGVALDGDGDRVLLVDGRGDFFDGDDVMATLGRRMARQGTLRGNTVVATVMSNFGLETALAEAGVRLVRTEVGDPAVSRAMRQGSYNLGGEQSGHLIFLDHATTGDGLLTALLMIAAMVESGRSLGELRALRRTPQVLHSVAVRERLPLGQFPDLAQLIQHAEQQLGARGRVLVRYSGTEMVARVMVEGEDVSTIEALAQEIAQSVDRNVGLRRAL